MYSSTTDLVHVAVAGRRITRENILPKALR